MMQIKFTTVNGNPGCRKITLDNFVSEDGATHLFRCNDGKGWYTRAVAVRKNPAAYIAWRVARGSKAELIGTL